MLCSLGHNADSWPQEDIRIRQASAVTKAPIAHSFWEGISFQLWSEGWLQGTTPAYQGWLQGTFPAKRSIAVNAGGKIAP